VRVGGAIGEDHSLREDVLLPQGNCLKLPPRSDIKNYGGDQKNQVEGDGKWERVRKGLWLKGGALSR